VLLLRTLAAVAIRPGLWPTAVTEALLLAEPGWWRHWPPLPLPAPAYLHFRVHTAYGDAVGRMNAAEVVDYLKWCRRMRVLG
jgi:hypothetical protein